jgi:hypothetical protein
MKSKDLAHDSLTRSDDVKLGSDRNFGIVFAVFCAIVAGIQLGFSHHFSWPWVAASCAFITAALLKPGLLHPLNVLWFKFGMLLHHIITPVVLGLMFFVVFTPIGLWMRIVRKRPLNLRFDPDAKTYWVERKPPGPPSESFKNQF